MAFTPNRSRREAAAVSSIPSEPVEETVLPADALAYNVSALVPDAQAVQDRESKSPGTVEGEIMDARTKAVMAMNAVRQLVPALRAAVGPGGDDRAQSQRFVDILDHANAQAVQACEVWGLEPDLQKNRWAMNSLERVFVEALAGTGAQVTDPALVSALVNAADVRRTRKDVWEEYSRDGTVQMALLKGMTPVWRAQMRFGFLRPAADSLHEASQKLLDAAGEAVLLVVSPLTPASERQTLFQIFMEEGGVVLADIWNAQASQAQKALSKHTAVSLKMWQTANPDGLPMAPVWAAFQQQMGRLVKLVSSARPQVRARR